MTEQYKHPAFPTPPNQEAVLWRYLDFEKFEWFVSNRRLFMPSAQFLGDPLEGTTPAGQLDWWHSLLDGAASEEQRRIIEQNKEKVSAFAQAFRPHYYVSCWHMNTIESTKMWRSYTKTSDAVAVVTTYQELRASLPAYVEIGMVRYIDYANERLPSLNMFEHITHKNINFCFECEVRAVALPPAREGVGAAHFKDNQFESESQKGFLVFAPDVDVAGLTHRVVLHPESSSEFTQRVRSICEGAGLPTPIPSAFSSKASLSGTF